MSSYRDFNATLEKFQEEIDNLEVVAGAYKKLAKLEEDYLAIKNNLDVSVAAISNSTKLLEEQLVVIKNNIQTEFDKISEKEKLFQNAVNDFCNEQSKMLENAFDDIKSTNKKFYSEFENTVKIKLEDNKLEIRKNIDTCEQKIKKINDSMVEYEKKIKTNKILLIAFGSVLFVLSIINLFV